MLNVNGNNVFVLYYEGICGDETDTWSLCTCTLIVNTTRQSSHIELVSHDLVHIHHHQV